MLSDGTADAGDGIDVGVPAHHRAGVEDGVAPHLHPVPQDGAELLPAGLQAAVPVLHHHQGLVGLDIGGDGPRTHVAAVAQDGVPYIVVVGDLDLVKEDDVLELHGVAHHAAGPHQGGAPDKGPVAHLGLRPDDAGGPQPGGGKDLGRLVDPHLGGRLVVFLRRELRPQAEDQVPDAVQGLPGVVEARQVFSRQAVGQVQQLCRFQLHHNMRSFCILWGPRAVLKDHYTVFSAVCKPYPAVRPPSAGRCGRWCSRCCRSPAG